MAALESYAEGTLSTLNYLCLEAAGVRDQQADHAASHLGKAVGIVTVLRGTVHHARRRKSYLPVAHCAKHKVCPWLRGTRPEPRPGCRSAALDPKEKVAARDRCGAPAPQVVYEQLFKGERQEAVKDVVLEVASVAKVHPTVPFALLVHEGLAELLV